jgi:DNA helicase-2/ATP-dependent DNA helicase PcrA
VAKVIHADADDASDVVIRSDEDTVAAAVDAVAGALASGTPAADIAVLARVNSLLAPVQAALAIREIPVSGGLGKEFATRTSVRAVLAWLRLATATAGQGFAAADVGEALRRPSRPLHPRIAEWVTEQESVAALRRLAGRVTNERDSQRLDAFADDIARLQRLAGSGHDTEHLVRTLVDDIGLGGSVATLDAKRHGMNRPAQGDDLLALAQLARLQPDPRTFETWLATMLATPRTESGVVLATVHRVKGQEWPVVVVHGAGAEQFPHRLADDVEEERRLFHVAITRTSRSVTVVAGERPSRFVAELSAEPPAVLPTDPSPRSRPERTTRRDASADPLVDRDSVAVGAGTVLVDGGREWHVESIDADGAVARQGDSTRRFAVGAKVTTSGRQRGRLVVLGDGDGDARGGRVATAFDELRQLRERLRDGKPAYVVFDDKTLAAIARALPDSLADLAAVKGVGPTKLEQYGDDVLGVVAAVTVRFPPDETSVET